ncbi:hypothetical protein PPACK8108_LOCUS5164 [Phakopsora pachyrhizi]|uniref:Uncharacterized protein n=1 Tax=Phakopsora pachyrhizi TaxID=170000 RepID=A0AAV0AR47_PHAPC|nr:hypothetical protein PPACK8108_LOCUS5164 [Phakopsora pachyrhizi]
MNELLYCYYYFLLAHINFWICEINLYMTYQAGCSTYGIIWWLIRLTVNLTVIAEPLVIVLYLIKDLWYQVILRFFQISDFKFQKKKKKLKLKQFDKRI